MTESNHQITRDASTEPTWPITIHVTAHADQIDTHHVWTDENGVTHGSLNLGLPSVVFHDPAQARQVAVALTDMADRMDKRIAEAAAQDAPECPACGSPGRRASWPGDLPEGTGHWLCSRCGSGFHAPAPGAK